MSLRMAAVSAIAGLLVFGGGVALQHGWTESRNATDPASERSPRELLVEKLGKLAKGKLLLPMVAKSNAIPPFPQVRAAGRSAAPASP